MIFPNAFSFFLGLQMRLQSAIYPRPPQNFFKANQGFLLALIKEPNVLFLGRVENPQSQ